MKRNHARRFTPDSGRHPRGRCRTGFPGRHCRFPLALPSLARLPFLLRLLSQRLTVLLFGERMTAPAGREVAPAGGLRAEVITEHVGVEVSGHHSPASLPAAT